MLADLDKKEFLTHRLCHHFGNLSSRFQILFKMTETLRSFFPPHRGSNPPLEVDMSHNWSFLEVTIRMAPPAVVDTTINLIFEKKNQNKNFQHVT